MKIEKITRTGEALYTIADKIDELVDAVNNLSEAYQNHLHLLHKAFLSEHIRKLVEGLK